jgi:hypothetical protein
MSQKNLFAGFDEAKEKEYEQEAIRLYGEDNVRPSIQRWNSYSAEKKQQIKEEGAAITTGLAAVMDQGAESRAAQDLLARWHQHLRAFYEPTPEILRGLGHLYNQSPDFIATFQKLHPDLPAFLEQAVGHYCDRLAGETRP